jgi:hypothetical protein
MTSVRLWHKAADLTRHRPPVQPENIGRNVAFRAVAGSAIVSQQ